MTLRIPQPVLSPVEGVCSAFVLEEKMGGHPPNPLTGGCACLAGRQAPCTPALEVDCGL
jgi:hypothetical protein